MVQGVAELKKLREVSLAWAYGDDTAASPSLKVLRPRALGNMCPRMRYGQQLQGEAQALEVTGVAHAPAHADGVLIDIHPIHRRRRVGGPRGHERHQLARPVLGEEVLHRAVARPTQAAQFGAEGAGHAGSHHAHAPEKQGNATKYADEGIQSGVRENPKV